MPIAPTLPALAFLISLKGLPGFGLHKVKPAPTDTLPPPWRPVSRLVLENEFVTAALPPIVDSWTQLKLTFDPRTLRVSVDPDSGTVSAGPLVNTVPVGPPLRLTFDSYADQMSRDNFRRLWIKKSVESINTRAAVAGANTAGGLSFKLPSPLPKQVQSLLGPGGPAINVAGSENIRLSGQSNWTNQQVGPLGQKRSLFPSLDMQQDLDIRLEGQLSDRIKVNLLQNSANQVPLANRIFINYKGDEDDMVQQLALGNTDLSLPGTQYVSYSGKNDGLFGIKSALRFGPADFTILASKQEGRSERASYTGGASHQTSTLADMDYIRGVFFLLYDPNVLPSWLPPSVAADPNFGGIDIPDASIKVYLDDYNYNNDVNVVRGKALVNPENRDNAVADSSAVRGSFSLLNPGTNADYEILQNVYGPFFKVLRLVKQVSGEQRLGVTYQARAVAKDGVTQLYPPVAGKYQNVGGEYEVDSPPDTANALRMKLLRAPLSQLSQDAVGNYDTTNVFNRVRDLELHNFYQLPGQRIDPQTFSLSIQRGVDQPPVTYVSLKDVKQTPVPYIEVLGLDNVDETTGQPVRGHDGKVDGSLVSSNSRAFVDYENGILFFPDPRPFAPRLTGANARPFEKAVSATLFRRDSLVADPDSADGANPFIYDKYNPRRDLDVRYYINLDFTAARAVGDISLGRGNILEGSEVITINGETLVRDRDYSIDYDIGRVTLKRQLGPADQLNVNYSYAPLFAQAGRTLVGSDFRIEGRDKRIGAALMYESTGAQDIRPRLGEEPSRSIIGDLNTELTFHPDWITHLVDRLPGIRTTTPSDFHIQAEMGVSLPNPNTKNVVYLDDMEGVKDAVSLTMTAEHWKHSSVPSRESNGTDTKFTSLPKYQNAEIQWYSPPSAVKEKDLNPSLTQAQGSDNSRQVLALSIPRRPTRGHGTLDAGGTPDTLWAGLTYALDQVGLDLSRSQFIDIWVNDFNDYHNGVSQVARVRGQGVKLHVDLGVVSEDQMRAPDSLPNGALDTEDLPPRDNILSVAGGIDEDTGLDGKKDKDEPGFGNPDPAFWRDLTTASASDPEGDDFHTVNEGVKDPIDTRKFFGTNGTEGNKNLLPIPDTEDLNLNNNLDTSENYFEYTIDLGQANSPYLVTNVQADYPAYHVDLINGWRRYRVPLSDSLRKVFGSPDLTIARHVRLWMEGIMLPDPTVAEAGSGPVRPLVVIGGLDIVGSRWQNAILDSAATANGTTVTLNSVNTTDNSDYVAPFNPGEALSGSQSVTRREQSLSVEFTRLMPGQTIEAFKTFSVEEDYSRYGALDWYATGAHLPAPSPADTALFYYVRFASDEIGQSYYEYRARLPRYNNSSSGWQTVHLPLTELSNLKLRPDFPINDPIRYAVAGPAPGESLIIVGRPSFTRLRRISVGLLNGSSQVYDSGQLWYDELRATDVAKDVGHAGRIQMDGKFANLFRYNLAYNERDANFVSVGESRGSGNSTSDLSLGGGFDVYRFFEGTGIVIPITGSYARNTSRPLFTAGDDVVRTGALQANSETGSESKSVGASYSRSWSDRSNPFLRYTIGGITGSYIYATNAGHSPTTLNNGVTRSATVSYGISPRNLLRLPIPHTRISLFPLPEHFFWNYGVSTSASQAFVVQRDGSILPQSNINARSAAITFGADTRPFDILHHHFDAVRSLTLPNNLVERIGFINLGRVTQWRQTFDSRYAMTRGPWLSPSISWNSNYNQDNRPDLSPDMSIRAINNGQSIAGSWALPFDRLGRSTVLPDSTHKGRRFSLGSLLSRLGGFSADASVNQSSAYSRLSGTPSIPYLIGITSQPGYSLVPGHGVMPQFGNSSSQSVNWRTAGRTRLSLGADVYLSLRAEYNNSRNNANGLLTRSIATKFPDFDFDYGRIAQLTHLTHFLENPSLRTSYTRSVQTDFLGFSATPTGRSISSQWSPLLSLSGTLKNQTRAELRIERRVSERENFQLVNSITTSRNTDVNLNLSRAYSKGQKVSVLGRESTVRSNINLSLAIVYSKESGETRQQGISQPQLPVDRDRLSLTGNGSYSFSNNVTGNLTLGYGMNRDIQRAILSQNVRVEVRAAFTF